MSAINGFLLDAMGQRYVEPLGFHLRSAYKDFDALTPLICMISARSNARVTLLKFSEEEECGMTLIFMCAIVKTCEKFGDLTCKLSALSTCLKY